MIECYMRALRASMFTWMWQHRIGLERQSVVALAIDISMHYWCEEKMTTCVSYETETDNSRSEIAGRPTSASIHASMQSAVHFAGHVEAILYKEPEQHNNTKRPQEFSSTLT